MTGRIAESGVGASHVNDMGSRVRAMRSAMERKIARRPGVLIVFPFTGRQRLLSGSCSDLASERVAVDRIRQLPRAILHHLSGFESVIPVVVGIHAIRFTERSVSPLRLTISSCIIMTWIESRPSCRSVTQDLPKGPESVLVPRVDRGQKPRSCRHPSMC